MGPELLKKYLARMTVEWGTRSRPEPNSRRQASTRISPTHADAPLLCITNVQKRTLAELFTSEHNFSISTDPLVVAANMIT
jgi:hypothetical protein